MGANKNKDFRKQLNLVLQIFDETNTAIFIVKEIEKRNISFDYHNLQICANQLEQDGYIQLLHGYSQSPFGSITARGKIFFQEGGYKNEKTKVDRIVIWFKNHPVFAIIIVGFLFLSSMSVIIAVVVNFLGVLKSK
ncbi:MAG TPA: hypothetical protein PLJ00_15955 [Chitinophagales bacterium]|nr:hypothetical protein [Chitinophagales bacterium]HRG85194.1 hypothetical protein [Chitinophagales bacterium]HRH52283.1 hypothetical protein [Chitinophagales bacterium]